MIGNLTLKALCDKYGISSEKIVNKNNNILISGEYISIDRTLNYLVNELKFNARDIERCPSILYRNVGYIRDNVEFLKSLGFSLDRIEACLHVLTTNPHELRQTYEYVVENYGIQAIKKNLSVLACKVNSIIEIEKLNLDKSWNLTIAVGVEFHSTTLDDVKKNIESEEFKKYPELFTSQTLVHAKIGDIKAIMHSEEFKEHPELFTSETLARAKIEDIKAIIHSEEFKKYPELFTSETLAQTKIEDIKAIIHSEEYKEHPELFTSTTLAHAKIEDIRGLLNFPCWNDNRFKKLLTPSVLANSRSMLKKLPILIKLSEKYCIDKYLNLSFLKLSLSQSFALINYLNDNNIPLVVDDKLNSVFSYCPGVLKSKFGIDLKELMVKYPFSELELEETKSLK